MAKTDKLLKKQGKMYGELLRIVPVKNWNKLSELIRAVRKLAQEEMKEIYEEVTNG